MLHKEKPVLSNGPYVTGRTLTFVSLLEMKARGGLSLVLRSWAAQFWFINGIQQSKDDSAQPLELNEGSACLV
jgi:hypothetical protein